VLSSVSSYALLASFFLGTTPHMHMIFLHIIILSLFPTNHCIVIQIRCFISWNNTFKYCSCQVWSRPHCFIWCKHLILCMH
jgi:hypothetical protein